MNLFNYITAAAPTTTVVCAKPCVLKSITVNKATATGVITVYNHPSAASNAVATITSPNPLLQNHFTLIYGDGIVLNNGCTIVTATAAQDITVAYSVL